MQLLKRALTYRMIVLSLSFGVSLSAIAADFEVPDGYRMPTKADIVDDWKRFDAPNHLKADFNGDGIEDEAYILPRKNSKLGLSLIHI